MEHTTNILLVTQEATGRDRAGNPGNHKNSLRQKTTSTQGHIYPLLFSLQRLQQTLRAKLSYGHPPTNDSGPAYPVNARRPETRPVICERTI